MFSKYNLRYFAYLTATFKLSYGTHKHIPHYINGRVDRRCSGMSLKRWQTSARLNTRIVTSQRIAIILATVTATSLIFQTMFPSHGEQFLGKTVRVISR
jgi:hypothetical protein